MALARAHVWNPGDILRSADLNGEFNNILLNPISLISPSTGVINFALQAHTNFRAENLAADPAAASTGRLFFQTVRAQLEVDDGTVIRGIPSISIASIIPGVLITSTANGQWSALNPGSSGQVLTMTSSNSAPAWATPAALATIASIGAWGNATTNAIVNSANVASIASTAVGTIEATWTTPFQNATYVINVTAFSAVGREVYARVNRMSSSSATLSIHDQNGTLQADTFLFTVITSS